MFGLTPDSSLKEAEEVLGSLNFVIEELIGNADGLFIAYCQEDPTFYAIHDIPEVAFQCVCDDVDRAVLEFLGYVDFLWVENNEVV